MRCRRRRGGSLCRADALRLILEPASAPLDGVLQPFGRHDRTALREERLPLERLAFLPSLEPRSVRARRGSPSVAGRRGGLHSSLARLLSSCSGRDADVALLHLVRQVRQAARSGSRRGSDRPSTIAGVARRVKICFFGKAETLRQANLLGVDRARARCAPTAPSPRARAPPSRARAARDLRGRTAGRQVHAAAREHQQRQHHASGPRRTCSSSSAHDVGMLDRLGSAASRGVVAVAARAGRAAGRSRGPARPRSLSTTWTCS